LNTAGAVPNFALTKATYFNAYFIFTVMLSLGIYDMMSLEGGVINCIVVS